jgi:hypothetical protein
MAWGDKGTLFVRSFGLSNVYAIKDNAREEGVKTILKGLNMPTGRSLTARSTSSVDKLIKYENAEANLDNLGAGKVVYDDMPPTPHMAGNISPSTRMAGSICRSDLRSTSAPASVADLPRRQDRQCRDLGARRQQRWWPSIRARRYWFTEVPATGSSDDMPSDKPT